MKIPLYIVDAFTQKPFSGNPAAVCPLQEWFDDTQLLSIAAENNLSETAFFVPQDEGFHLRWFTPAVEVPLCGHATLATSHVLFNHMNFSGNEIVFESKSGPLQVKKRDNLILMNFPANTPSESSIPDHLVHALGKQPQEALQSENTLMVVYETEDDILSINPDFLALEDIDQPYIIVTAPGSESDFVSRFFGPRVGVPEDPVTGSAHCTLVPYWSKRLNKTSLYAKQVSKRGGDLFCEYFGERVEIVGRAVTYAIEEIL